MKTQRTFDEKKKGWLCAWKPCAATPTNTNERAKAQFDRVTEHEEKQKQFPAQTHTHTLYIVRYIYTKTANIYLTSNLIRFLLGAFINPLTYRVTIGRLEKNGL